MNQADGEYVRFAMAYARYARAVFVFTSVSPAIREKHRRAVEDMTKQTWAECKRFGIEIRKAKAG